MAKYFFETSKSAHEQITSIFDFVWPTATAMWNLRWQVEGFIKVTPAATVAQLRARFSEGTDIHGANLKRACIDHTWQEQKQIFAKILLTNTIAIYEGWIEETLKSMGKNTSGFQKALQYPDSSTGGKGAQWAILGVTATESIPLKNSFHKALCVGHLYSLVNIDAILLCYRFFKELRNCDMHRGGVADQRLIDAYGQFSAVATPALLGIDEVPVHDVPVMGSRTKISLRGVVGFTSLVLKIIATLDAELSRSKDSETPFIRKWKAANPHKKMLSGKPKKREQQVKKLAIKAGFPNPEHANQLGDWLAKRGLSQF